MSDLQLVGIRIECKNDRALIQSHSAGKYSRSALPARRRSPVPRHETRNIYKENKLTVSMLINELRAVSRLAPTLLRAVAVQVRKLGSSFIIQVCNAVTVNSVKSL